MAVIYFLIFFATNCLATGIVKYASDSLPTKQAVGSSIYIIVMSVTAMIFFGVGNGFKLSINSVTLGYAFAFALICLVVNVANLFRYRYVSVANATVITSASSLILNALIGFFAFKETISANTILKSVLMLGAIFMVFLSSPRGEKKTASKTAAVFWLTVSVLGASGTTVITRLFSRDESVTDTNSLFFMTNVFMLACALVVFFVCLSREGERTRAVIRCFGVRGCAAISLNTVLSNIGTLCTTLILGLVDVSLYSPTRAALGVITGAVVSLAFRERLDKMTLLALAVSVIAIFI